MTNHNPNKDSMLAEWTAEMRNEHLRLSNPENYLLLMQWRLAQMEATGAFDQLEIHDLRELVQSAYSAALEEQFSHELYCKASSYNVVPDGCRRRTAHIIQGNYYEEIRRAHFLYDGRVVEENGRISIKTYGGASEIGVIEGLRLSTQSGWFQLIETSRATDSGWIVGVTDADGYRALVDLAQAEFENQNWGRYRILRDRVRYSPYACCPLCGDTFARRDECAQCNGLGFIPRDLGDPKECAED